MPATNAYIMDFNEDSVKTSIFSKKNRKNNAFPEALAGIPTSVKTRIIVIKLLAAC
jgi:hypothetical protein